MAYQQSLMADRAKVYFNTDDSNKVTELFNHCPNPQVDSLHSIHRNNKFRPLKL